MQRRILTNIDFRSAADVRVWLSPMDSEVPLNDAGAIFAAPRGKTFRARLDGIRGHAVHTRNGDTIELWFRPPGLKKGSLLFVFSGGFEFALATLDFRKGRISLSTADWTRPQPVASAPLTMGKRSRHILRLGKTEAGGRLVKNADITVYLDGSKLLTAKDVNVLPEMGVDVRVTGARLVVQRLVHRGNPSGIPEYLHVGGWQMLNRESIEENYKSICRGLRQAANEGVELLVTPETSLSGLFPESRVTRQPKPVADTERKLRRFIRELRNAPYLVVGLPVWESVPGHGLQNTRYNVSRVYDPEGHTVSTHAKIHSCETRFWHGYRLQEFNVHGVPVTMHICHDGRYPEVWTLPVMFGARLILHPSNGGKISGSVDAFEAKAKLAPTTSHAFYIHVNGGGGSYLVGPQKFNNLIAVSPECRRDVPSFPTVGEPREGLFHARVRIHDAFGYWPVRSFRTSEAAAKAYVSLYRSLGGRRNSDERRWTDDEC